MGLTRHDVRTEVRARRWHAPSPHTIAVQTGSLNQRQRWWVAILETGCAEAALDGLSAARLTTELAHVARHRRRSVVTGVLADIADGTQALGELDLSASVAATGFRVRRVRPCA